MKAAIRPVLSGQENPRSIYTYNSDNLRRERWAFAKRESILSWDPTSKMPEFRDLIAQGGIEWIDLPEIEILKGERLQNYWITSHRWFHKDHPDWDPDHPQNQGAKLRELQRMLQEHPHIRGVWMDYLCVPQGQKDAREQDFFQFTLDNIKMLYLSGQVVIFVDQKYMGRFWTQYEAFLSLHKATRNGILPKTLDEVEISVRFVEMGAAGAAGGGVKRAIIDTWRNKNVSEAVGILYEPDVEVTNLADKDSLLRRLPDLENHVMELFLEVQQEAQAAEDESRRIAEERAQNLAHAEAEAKAAAEWRMEKEQLEGSIADCTARITAIEARIRIAEREEAAAVQSRNYGRADKLKMELEHIAAERKQLQANGAECRSRLRKLSLVVTADSLNAVPASAKVAAEIAGLDVKLQGLQKRLDEAKLVPAAQKDTRLIKSLKSDFQETQVAKEGKLAEQRRIEEKEQANEAAKQKAKEEQKAEEARARQELLDQQSRERAQQAVEQKTFEDEHASIEAQLEAADEAEDYDRVEELQRQHQALPKTLDEWRARKEARKAAKRALEVVLDDGLVVNGTDDAVERQRHALEEAVRAAEPIVEDVIGSPGARKEITALATLASEARSHISKLLSIEKERRRARERAAAEAAREKEEQQRRAEERVAVEAAKAAQAAQAAREKEEQKRRAEERLAEEQRIRQAGIDAARRLQSERRIDKKGKCSRHPGVCIVKNQVGRWETYIAPMD